jgi:hypothetical protein
MIEEDEPDNSHDGLECFNF